jgi:hypothetical protein
VTIVVVVATVLTGCGDSERGSAPTADSTKSGAHSFAAGVDDGRYVGQAEAVCSRGLEEIGALGRRLPRALSHSSAAQDPITSALIEPGLEILRREASRLRKLGPAPGSRALRIYLGLFDPILELARQRLYVGTTEPEHARNLELMIASLSDEQSAAAKRFGLAACSVGFTTALGGLE